MNKKQKITIGVLGVLFIISLITMIVVLVSANAKPPFVPPEFEASAILGEPDSKIEGYSVLGQDGMNYKVGFCGKPQLKDGKTYVYFANIKDNNVWLKLRALDKDGNQLYDTGIIKPGQYIEYIELGENIKAKDEVKFKIMAYQPDTYYSEGAVSLNTVIA